MRITKDIIHSITSLKPILDLSHYAKLVNDRLSHYELTVEAVQEFKNQIDPETISKNDLDPESINALTKLNLFNVKTWLKNTEYKNIDILISDEFINKYDIDVEPILIKTKRISDAIFKKYFNYNETVKRNFIINYHGDLMSVENVIDNYELVKDIFFDIKIIKDALAHEDEKMFNFIFEHHSFTPTKVIDILTSVFIANYLKTNYNKIQFIYEDYSLSKMKTSEYFEKIKTVVSRYPIDIVNKLLCSIIDFKAEEYLYNTVLQKRIANLSGLELETKKKLLPLYKRMGNENFLKFD